MKIVYALLVVVGTVIPLSQLYAWLVQHGLNITLLIEQAFGSKIAAFAWFDVIVAGVALLFFIGWEGRRLKMKRLWLPVLGTCAVGVSLGLPLFLLMREIRMKDAWSGRV